jgi:hypothetical protein
MAILIEPQSEIIPGYRLLDRLGSGGFGEVWRAEAPGGLLKAIKIVYGDMSENAAGHRAEQELNALKRVQSVRHPYLLSIDRYDIIDGRLLIVTELADGNLWDRFQEFRARRQPGIPREDLLRYLQEAAEVLDLMNNQYQLQHLDVKPQNLFLVHDHIKVADFGLVRDVDSVREAHAHAGATPVYAAPETFEGAISPYSDQYSLAVVYQELLTGKRPFQAANMQQLIAQHLQAAPDLLAVPPGDRAVVARALSKRPDDRHPSCLAFVRALASGGGAALAVSAAPAAASAPALAPEPAPPAPLWRNDTPATQMLFAFQEEMNVKAGAGIVPAPPEQTGDGVLFPALVIGIGEVALQVLQRVRLALTEHVGQLNRIPNVRLLFIDTDPETAHNATAPDSPSPLTPEEVFTARLNRPGHYLKARRNGRSIIEGWFDPQLLYRIKPGNPLTQGMRALGRLAFCDHYRTIEEKLRDEFQSILAPAAMDHAESHTQLSLRSNRPRVYIVTGLGGGTGSGMFLDMAYAVRHRLKLLGHEKPDVVGILLMPPAAGPTARSLAVANTYAALTELNHFSVPGITYTACIDDKDVTLLDQAPPFERFCLVPLRSANPQSTEAVGITVAAEFLRRDLVTPFGRCVDESREQVRALPGVTPEPGTVAGQTFGLRAISFPRRILLDRASRWLCCRLLDGWTSADTRALSEPVRQWLAEQLTTLQLTPDNLLQSLQRVCKQALGQAPEQHIAGLIEPFVPKSRWSRGAYDSAAVFQVLSQLVECFGSPGDGGPSRQPGVLEQALSSIIEGAVKEWSDKLERLALCLIEHPDYRLVGTDIAITAIAEMLEQAESTYQPLADERASQAQVAYVRTEQYLEEDTRRKATAEIAECLRAFATSRYQGLVARFLVQIFQRLAEELGDARQQAAHCRQRLTTLRQHLQPGAEPETPPGTLLPEGCQTTEEAVHVYLEAIDAAALRELDHNVQGMIEKQFTSLRHICGTSSDLMAKFESAWLQSMSKVMQQRLGDIDVTEMFLARAADTATAVRRLSRAFAEAESSLEAPESPPDSTAILAVPAGKAAEAFLQMVQHSLPQTQLAVTASPDDIVFYREQVTVPLKCLLHLNENSRTAYEQLLSQQCPLHTRGDIRQWYRVDMM